jgi:glycosyltransferase involved in cell wall biosynthesis
MISSEWRLHRKHPQTRPPRWSVRWGPVVRVARYWQRLATEQRVVNRSSSRAIRLAFMASGQIVTAVWTAVTMWRREVRTAIKDTSVPRSRLRVAYVGPYPERGGAVSGCAWLIVAGLADLGFEIDCYVEGPLDEPGDELAALPGVRVLWLDTGWRYDRWYSRSTLAKFATGSVSRVFGRRRIAALLEENHLARPYDVVYQFSAMDLYGLRSRLSRLPPLVLHPEVHAAGELRWQKAERSFAARIEPSARRSVVYALLSYRSWRQRRDARAAAAVIAISHIFAGHLARDCAVDESIVTVIPNPIDLDGLSPVVIRSAESQRQILFVGRMSVRKGVEQVVALSHRLVDLAGSVRIDCVGDASLWSDYTPLLGELNSSVAEFLGPMSYDDLTRLVRSADLLIQPSKYEPFGLTVGEALACGVPIVATTEVGAAEDVDSGCCVSIPPNDVSALEHAVRSILDRIAVDEHAIRSLARTEAERLFSPDRVVRQIADVLMRASVRDGARFYVGADGGST